MVMVHHDGTVKLIKQMIKFGRYSKLVAGFDNRGRDSIIIRLMSAANRVSVFTVSLLKAKFAARRQRIHPHKSR